MNAKIRVGSWPGSNFEGNAFIRIFCESICKQGAMVVDVADPQTIGADALDILQIHWPEQVFWGRRLSSAIIACLETLLAIRRLRRSGVSIFWMVHNLSPHDASWRLRIVWGAYSRFLAREVDCFVALSPTTLPAIVRRFGPRKWQMTTWVRHPGYPMPELLETKEAARERVGVQAPPSGLLLVFIGMIRPYKGLELLLEAVSGRPNIRLVLAGKADGSYAMSLSRAAASAGNVDLRLRWQNDEEYRGLVRASDFVVLPYAAILHSGSAVHALSLGRPVLVPNTPYMCDLESVVGREWVRLYDGKFDAEAISHLDLPQGSPNLSALSPEAAFAGLVDTYRACADRARTSRD